MAAGYVYLFRLGEFHKIGHSRRLKQRSACFSSLPYPFAVVHHYYSSDATAEEKRLHRLYAAYRVKGEWFRLSNEQVGGIAAISGDTPPADFLADEFVTVAINVASWMKQELISIAKANRRTLGMEIRIALEEWLVKNGAWPRPDATSPDPAASPRQPQPEE